MEGRYVRLPVITPLPDLSTTWSAALRVLTGMKRRFSRDDLLRQRYVNFMRQYKNLSHMTLVEANSVSGERVSYLPHHEIMRQASSTKLRVVFNGSIMTLSGCSLNLMVGSNLLPTKSIAQMANASTYLRDGRQKDISTNTSAS